MILCTAQIAPCWNDPGATLQKIRTRVAEAVECDATFIAFPEQVITGWDPEDATSFVQDDQGFILSTLREYARDFSIAILGSFREASMKGPRNTAVAIGAGGEILARYSKMHLFSPGKEDRYYSPGKTIAPFSIEGCTCGIAVCYDLRFADLFRLYREADVHLMLVPSAWPAARMKHFELFISGRAAEFQMYVAGINTCGATPVDQYKGGSLVAGPDGTVISRGCEGEELIFTEINPDWTEKARNVFPVFSDRKDAVYQQLSGF